jgi:superfamily II RNA helicase
VVPKALVECLFERGLLKLIFATETLAAGIHMPARAVILSQLEKKDTAAEKAAIEAWN